MQRQGTCDMSRMRMPHNSRFYEDGAAYFRALHTRGETDFEFEDEYYFTMPALSGGSEA